jgi:uncharacterized membrane protein
LVVGFKDPKFEGKVIEELDRLRKSDVVRVIDGMVVHKDADGDIEVARLSNLTDEEKAEYGTVIGALIGLGFEGEEGMVVGAELGAERAAEGKFGEKIEEEAWDVLSEIPNGTAAAMVLLEHHWAIPLRNAIIDAGGFRINDGFIHPEDLVAIGLLAREDADSHHFEPTTA